jgi:hypothetical protein
MVEHLADGLAANARLANDLPNRDTLPEDPISDARPLRDVAVHELVILRQRRSISKQLLGWGQNSPAALIIVAWHAQSPSSPARKRAPLRGFGT